MHDDIGKAFLESVTKRFASTKALGEGALAQLPDADLRWTPGPESNSIAVIVQHLRGNMRSRWTNFLTEDGEKPWRERDAEFVEPESVDRDLILRLWKEGWACVFAALAELEPQDLSKSIVIRGQPLSALDAINRQLAHYSYHVGQMVYLVRIRCGGAWQTLSVARGQSKNYVPRRQD